MSSVLSNKDVNAPVQVQDANNNTKVAGAKALEYQRQLLQSKMEEEKYGTTTTTTTTNAIINATVNAITNATVNATVNATTNVTANVTTNATNATSTDGAAARVHSFPQKYLSANLEDAANGRNKQHYISPSDNIMSPCTAKLTALKGRQASRAKPKSLFAQSSAKKFDSENIFGGKTAPHPNPNPNPFGGDHDGNGNIQPRGI
ncbi:hypothetical protein AAE478_004728 [Parahypoxylon ruwenzoriense]